MDNTIRVEELSQEELKVTCASLMNRLDQELDRAKAEMTTEEFVALCYYIKHECQRIKQKKLAAEGFV